MLRRSILTMSRWGEASGPFSTESGALLDKIIYEHFGTLTSEKLIPAALELANLTNGRAAIQMLKEENANLPTINWFTRQGYELNTMTNNCSAEELLASRIYRIMQGPKRDPLLKAGQADFDRAFRRI